MPLPSAPSLSAVRLQRLFHSSALRSSSKNYYEILHVSPTATPAEVKTSFYALSKSYHPDRNPSDPNASKRFVEISEAYATLCIPAKRQAYDREHISSHTHTPHRPQGSYSSTHHSPAGGRAPSGLSRRRTTFTGPPPSFYRSGGWGEHSAKRKAAQQEGAPAREAPDFGETVNPNATGGMGYGERPVGHEVDNDVPHFDREGHYRTHVNHDRRRMRRRRPGEAHIPNEGAGGALANFLFVGVIVGFAAFAPAMLFR